MSIIQTSNETELKTVADELHKLILAKSSDKAVTVSFSGELGAGKTTLIQFLAKTFNIEEVVTSPTYVVMKRYDLTKPTKGFNKLIHIDAYRIEDVDEMRVLGFAELLAEKNTIICIEWPEKIASLIPEDIISVSIKIPESGRLLTITDGKN